MAEVTGQEFKVGGAPAASLVPVTQADGSTEWAAATGFDLNPVPVTTDYTANPGELVLVDSTLGPVTITLPDTPADGTVVGVKDAVAAGPQITVSPGVDDGWCNADGAQSNILNGSSVTVQFNENLWYITSNDYPAFAATDSTNPGGSLGPTGTTSLTYVMMGLNEGIAPAVTGNVLVTLTGQISNSSALDGATVQLKYGIGSGPANGDAVTGTSLTLGVSSTLASGMVPFCLVGLIVGETPGVPLWVDAALAAVTGGMAQLAELTLVLVEV